MQLHLGHSAKYLVEPLLTETQSDVQAQEVEFDLAVDVVELKK